jgi:hypothetical protein
MKNPYQEKFAYPIPRTAGKVKAHRAPRIQEFIRHSPFCIVATSNAQGDCDASAERIGCLKICSPQPMPAWVVDG